MFLIDDVCYFKAPYLANIHFVRVFARRCTVGGEDGGAVAVGVSVDQGNGVVEIVGLQDDEHRSKDLLFVARHVRLENTKRSGASSKHLVNA